MRLRLVGFFFCLCAIENQPLRYNTFSVFFVYNHKRDFLLNKASRSRRLRTKCSWSVSLVFRMQKSLHHCYSSASNMKPLIVLLLMIGGLINTSRYGKKIFSPTVVHVLFDIYEKKKQLSPQFRKGVVSCTVPGCLAMCNDIGDVQKESKHSFICFYVLSKIRIQHNILSCFFSFTCDTIYDRPFLFLWDILNHGLYTTLQSKNIIKPNDVLPFHRKF